MVTHTDDTKARPGQCTAKANSTGKRCRRQAIKGGNVCYVHGGAAPQVKRAARLRLADLVSPAIKTLGRVMVDQNAKHSDQIRAAENVLDRTGMGRQQTIDVARVRADIEAELDRLMKE